MRLLARELPHRHRPWPTPTNPCSPHHPIPPRALSPLSHCFPVHSTVSQSIRSIPRASIQFSSIRTHRQHPSRCRPSASFYSGYSLHHLVVNISSTRFTVINSGSHQALGFSPLRPVATNKRGCNSRHRRRQRPRCHQPALTHPPTSGGAPVTNCHKLSHIRSLFPSYSRRHHRHATLRLHIIFFFSAALAPERLLAANIWPGQRPRTPVTTHQPGITNES